MTTPYDAETLKRTLIDLLRTDQDFQDIVKGVLVSSFTTREETKAILEEIKELRTDFNTRMGDFNTRMDELRTDFNNQMKEMRSQFDQRFNQFDIKLNSLGARWGISNEKAVREALKGLYQEKFSVNVKQWTYYDKEGKVFKQPSVIEIDAVIHNSEHTLIEIKSHISKSDVAELIRIAEVYQEQEKPEKLTLVIISPYVDEKAEEFAKAFNVSIYSEKMG